MLEQEAPPGNAPSMIISMIGIKVFLGWWLDMLISPMFIVMEFCRMRGYTIVNKWFQRMWQYIRLKFPKVLWPLIVVMELIYTFVNGSSILNLFSHFHVQKLKNTSNWETKKNKNFSHVLWNLENCLKQENLQCICYHDMYYIGLVVFTKLQKIHGQHSG